MSWQDPDETLCTSQGRTVPSTPISRPFSTGKTTRAIPLLSLCRQQYWRTTEHISLSALAPPFQADQCWIFAGISDRTNVPLQAYCFHVASVSSPSHPPHIMHAETTNPPEELNSIWVPPRNPSLEPAELVSKSVWRVTVQLYKWLRKERETLQSFMPEHPWNNMLHAGDEFPNSLLL